MSGHTPEPWDPRGYDPFYGPVVLETEEQLIAKFERVEDRNRAQSCVNALAGVADPAAFVRAARELLKASEQLTIVHSLGTSDRSDADLESAHSDLERCMDVFGSADTATK